MNATIEVDVADENQRAALQLALSDPLTKAATIVTGILLPLDPEERRRVIAATAILYDMPLGRR